MRKQSVFSIQDRIKFISRLFWCDRSVRVQLVGVSCSCLGGPLWAAGGKRLEVLGSSRHCQLCCLYCLGGWSYCGVEIPIKINGNASINVCVIKTRFQIVYDKHLSAQQSDDHVRRKLNGSMAYEKLFKNEQK